MKKFQIITKVKSVTTLQYIVEANSLEEAYEIICEGEQRGEGEEINNKIKWESEIIKKSELIEGFNE